MTCYLLVRGHYDYTERIAVYTKAAMEIEKQSWLNVAKAQNQVDINEYNKQINDKEEKKQEYIICDSQLLAEAKKLKENGELQQSKMLNKERKRLQRYIDEITFEISKLEKKICALKILTDSEIINSYMNRMDYYFEEIEFFE